MKSQSAQFCLLSFLCIACTFAWAKFEVVNVQIDSKDTSFISECGHSPDTANVIDVFFKIAKESTDCFDATIYITSNGQSSDPMEKTWCARKQINDLDLCENPPAVDDDDLLRMETYEAKGCDLEKMMGNMPMGEHQLKADLKQDGNLIVTLSLDVNISN